MDVHYRSLVIYTYAYAVHLREIEPPCRPRLAESLCVWSSLCSPVRLCRKIRWRIMVSKSVTATLQDLNRCEVTVQIGARCLYSHMCDTAC